MEAGLSIYLQLYTQNFVFRAHHQARQSGSADFGEEMQLAIEPTHVYSSSIFGKYTAERGQLGRLLDLAKEFVCSCGVPLNKKKDKVVLALTAVTIPLHRGIRQTRRLG